MTNTHLRPREARVGGIRRSGAGNATAGENLSIVNDRLMVVTRLG